MTLGLRAWRIICWCLNSVLYGVFLAKSANSLSEIQPVPSASIASYNFQRSSSVNLSRGSLRSLLSTVSHSAVLMRPLSSMSKRLEKSWPA